MGFLVHYFLLSLFLAIYCKKGTTFRGRSRLAIVFFFDLRAGDAIKYNGMLRFITYVSFFAIQQ